MRSIHCRRVTGLPSRARPEVAAPQAARRLACSSASARAKATGRTPSTPVMVEASTTTPISAPKGPGAPSMRTPRRWRGSVGAGGSAPRCPRKGASLRQ
ncbi:MAG: hypothetical protein ACRDV9_12140 [Acidimicrobiia bacterium]